MTSKETDAMWQALDKMAENERELGIQMQPAQPAALHQASESIEDFKQRLARSIELMPFGDTAASFAVYIREFK